MSNYNSILQTNNSSLEEIITQLNNLPDAGSGGASLETCALTITKDRETADITVYYMDENLNKKSYVTNALDQELTRTVTILKNSIICFYTPYNTSMSGAYADIQNNDNLYTKFISGDTTILITVNPT